MNRVLTGVLWATLFAGTCFGQNVKLKVQAALYDRDLNLKPVPHLTVKLVPASPGIHAVTLQTNFEGRAETELPVGTYHVVSDASAELFDKLYRWDFDASFNRSENSLELSNDNA